jgi:hypothetical protein
MSRPTFARSSLLDFKPPAVSQFARRVMMVLPGVRHNPTEVALLQLCAACDLTMARRTPEN